MSIGSKVVARLLMVTVAVVAVTATAASARVLEILNGDRGFRDVWRSLEFINSLGGATVRCAVTLEGEFDTLVVEKVAGRNISSVRRVALGACTGGSATILTEGLPWELTYDSFTGTLPSIASIRQRLLGAAFQVRNEAATCLVRSEARNPLYTIASTTREAGGLLEMPSLRVEEIQTFPLTGGFGCELSTGRLAGTATTTVQGETAKLTVRLIEQIPTVSLAPATVNIPGGATTAERKYTITNTGGQGDIRVWGVGLSDAVRFRVEDAGGMCANRVLGPGATCQFEVNYVGGAIFEGNRPTSTGVNISWDAGRSVSASVQTRAR